MSPVGTTPTTQNSCFGRLLSKRKLEDSEITCFRRIRKSSSSNCKGKSVLAYEFESFTVGSSDDNVVAGESSSSNCEFTKSDLQFFVRMMSAGKTLVVRANLEDTVELVLFKIQKMTGIPVMEQRLIYRGKQLQWEQTLKQCKIQNDSGLQLVGRMRSTDHPEAWRVISEMISSIWRICKKEIPYDAGQVSLKMEEFLDLPLDKLDKKNEFPSVIHNKTDKKKRGKKKKTCVDDDEDGLNKKKRDYCKIFMDACAPKGLIMLYMSEEKRNRDCADQCIRSFIEYVKDLRGSWRERDYCVTPVLEFCKLLKMMVREDDSLYKHCRSALGSILKKAEEGLRGCLGEMYGVIVSDGFPFLKEIGQKLVKDLVQSFESDTSSGPFRQDVVDFSAFLQPILSLIEKKLAAAASSRIAKEKTDPLADEVNHLFLIFSDLLCWIDKCLHKLELCLALNSDVEIYTSRWSQCLAILKELHSISRLYPGSDDRFQTTMRQYKAGIRILILKYAKRADDNSWLIKHKDALDFESKRHLAMLLFPEVTEDYDELFEMLIDRSNLLAESYEYIYKAESSSLHAGLFMQFKDEEATGPGVLREWFCLVCQAIFDPQNALFASCPLDRRRFFPNPASKVHSLHLQYFKFSGKVVALALMHKIQVGVVLDRIFFLQLAGRRVSLEDIRDADPCIYNSCKKILEMDTDFVDSDALGLTFVTEVEELGTIKSVELCSGGKDIAVNSRNRRKYVDLIVQHHFVTSIADQVSSFAKGFRDILNYGVFHGTFFKSLELEDLDWMLHGSESEICVEDWMSHTEYNGYEKSDPQIVWFWEVVRNLSPEQRKTLLFFWTSIKYLPIEGFRGLASRLYIYKSSDPEDFLPSSHTCFYQLCIPPYPSRDVMRQRLLVITQQHVGCSFGTY